MVEDVDLVIIECDDDFLFGVVIQVPDADIQAVAAIAMISRAVDVGVVAFAGGGVVTWPGLEGQARRLVQAAIWVKDKNLRSIRLGLSRGSHYLDAAVVIQIASGHPRTSGHWPAEQTEAGQPIFCESWLLRHS